MRASRAGHLFASGGALLASAATAGMIVAGKGIPSWAFLSLLVVASAGYGAILFGTRALDPRIVFAAIGLVTIIAVVFPSRTSNDVWAYSIYGRIVVAHHASPYTHAPEEFASDPYFPQAKAGYHDVKSVYGPVFTGLSAGVMKIADENKTLARVLWQSIAALAVIAALVLIWRKTRDPVAVAFLGLNPAIAASVINGGHNDALLGLAVLAGSVVAPASPFAAGLLLGIGASIKIVGLIPLAAVAAWSWHRSGVRRGMVLAATGVAVLVAGYALVGGTTALGPLHRGSRLAVRHSIWFYPKRWIASSIHDVARAQATHIAAGRIAYMGLGLVLAVTAIVVLARLREERPERLAAVGMAPYLLGAPYVLPWYPAWVLPSLATTKRSVVAKLAALDAILLFAVDPDRYAHTPGTGGAFVHVFARIVMPIAEVGALCALIAWTVMLLRTGWQRRRGRPSPASGAPLAREAV